MSTARSGAERGAVRVAWSRPAESRATLGIDPARWSDPGRLDGSGLGTVVGVRLADGPTESVSIEIAADADAVWRLVTDIDLPARFSEEFVGGEWLDGATGPALGARFRGSNERGDLRWSVTCTVIEYEPGRRFGWSVGEVDDPLARWRFTITPHDDGVVLEEWCWMGTAPSGLSAAIERRPEREAQIVEYRMNRHRDAMTATITGIKQLAEA